MTNQKITLPRWDWCLSDNVADLSSSSGKVEGTPKGLKEALRVGAVGQGEEMDSVGIDLLAHALRLLASTAFIAHNSP